MTETVLGIIAGIAFVAFFILFDRVGELEEEVTDLKRDVNGLYVHKERKSDKTEDLIDRIERIVSAKLFSDTDSGM